MSNTPIDVQDLGNAIRKAEEAVNETLAQVVAAGDGLIQDLRIEVVQNRVRRTDGSGGLTAAKVRILVELGV